MTSAKCIGWDRDSRCTEEATHICESNDGGATWIVKEGGDYCARHARHLKTIADRDNARLGGGTEDSSPVPSNEESEMVEDIFDLTEKEGDMAKTESKTRKPGGSKAPTKPKASGGSKPKTTAKKPSPKPKASTKPKTNGPKPKTSIKKASAKKAAPQTRAKKAPAKKSSQKPKTEHKPRAMKMPTGVPDPLKVPKDLKDMKQVDAMVAIAKANKKFFPLNAGSKLMLAHGFFANAKDPQKQASKSCWPSLVREGAPWEKAGKGLFKYTGK